MTCGPVRSQKPSGCAVNEAVNEQGVDANSLACQQGMTCTDTCGAVGSQKPSGHAVDEQGVMATVRCVSCARAAVHVNITQDHTPLSV